MTLASVYGQQRAVDALRAALRGGSVHHAYLFAGPEGVGKERAAVGLAQALTCPDKPLEGCGVCSSCTRIERGSHPDVLWLMPDAERVERGLVGRADITGTPSRDIRVAQVRALQERLSLRGLESSRKVAIVASAEAMNDQAQNAFLKTLEEPPSDTTLVLLCSAVDRLLPTIRSRCSKVHFGPLPLDFLAQRVQQERKLEPDTAALVAVMAGGSLGRALALDVKALGRRKELITRFEQLPADDALPLLRFAEEHGGSRDDAEQALTILTLWTRDVAVARGGSSVALANRDLEPLAREVAGRLSDAALHRRFALIERALGAIVGRNGAPRLQLERMLIEMMEAR
jgi:DNA polymerase III subunit delta'